MKKRIECVITGRVQMVMFRDFAQRKARKRSIMGFVKNNEDGSVIVIAEGEEKALQSFIGELERGPLFARVNCINVEWSDIVEGFVGFSIHYSSYGIHVRHLNYRKGYQKQ